MVHCHGCFDLVHPGHIKHLQAARRVLAGRPGLDVALGRVSAGLNHVRVENVRVVRDGGVLTLPAAEAELPERVLFVIVSVP